VKLVAKKITYDKVKLQSAKISDDHDSAPYSEEGFTLMNARYVED
jgi:hypothetical protein